MPDTPLRSDALAVLDETVNVSLAAVATNPARLKAMQDDCRSLIHALLSAQGEQPSSEAGRCHHGWRGTAIDGQIQTPCPACGAKSLFIGEGGHLTCARLPNDHNDGCHSPSVERTVNDLKAEIRALHAGHAKRDASPQPSSDGLAGIGGECSACGFRYAAYKGHLIPCPRCEAERLRSQPSSDAQAVGTLLERIRYHQMQVALLTQELTGDPLRGVGNLPQSKEGT